MPDYSPQIRELMKEWIDKDERILGYVECSPFHRSRALRKLRRQVRQSPESPAEGDSLRTRWWMPLIILIGALVSIEDLLFGLFISRHYQTVELFALVVTDRAFYKMVLLPELKEEKETLTLLSRETYPLEQISDLRFKEGLVHCRLSFLYRGRRVRFKVTERLFAFNQLIPFLRSAADRALT